MDRGGQAAAARGQPLSWSFERLAGPYTLTEGPAWDGDGLLFSDIQSDRILRFDPATGRIDVFRTGTDGGNGLTFDPEGRLYGCQQWSRRIVRYEPDGSTTVIVDRLDGRRLNSPNDLAIHSNGTIYFSNTASIANPIPAALTDFIQ